MDEVSRQTVRLHLSDSKVEEGLELEEGLDGPEK